MVYTALSSYKFKPIKLIGVWHNADLGLISVTLDGGSSYTTLADKDLGANQLNGQGSRFQWGNNKAFDPNNPGQKINDPIDPAGYGPSNHLYIESIKQRPYIQSATNTNLWGGDESDITLKKGPCENGFHIPTVNEMTVIYNVFKDMTVEKFKEVFFVYPNYTGWGCDRREIQTDLFVRRCSNSTVEENELYGSGCYCSIYDQPNRYFNPTFARKVTCLVGYIRPFANSPVTPSGSGWTLIYEM